MNDQCEKQLKKIYDQFNNQNKKIKNLYKRSQNDKENINKLYPEIIKLEENLPKDVYKKLIRKYENAKNCVKGNEEELKRYLDVLRLEIKKLKSIDIKEFKNNAELKTKLINSAKTLNQSLLPMKQKLAKNIACVDEFVLVYSKINFCIQKLQNNEKISSFDLAKQFEIQKNNKTENIQNESINIENKAVNIEIKLNSEKNIDNCLKKEDINTEKSKNESKNESKDNENKQEKILDNKTEIKQKTETIQKDNSEYKLVLSKDNVYLPYKRSDIEKIYNDNKDKYKSLDDVIEKNYKIDSKRYRFKKISRFKEAYNLMRKKENASFIQSLDLALELSFNKYLNSAVITACKNVDELDIYLDYLKNNRISDFKIFDIEYDI